MGPGCTVDVADFACHSNLTEIGIQQNHKAEWKAPRTSTTKTKARVCVHTRGTPRARVLWILLASSLLPCDVWHITELVELVVRSGAGTQVLPWVFFVL